MQAISYRSSISPIPFNRGYTPTDPINRFKNEISFHFGVVEPLIRTSFDTVTMTQHMTLQSFFSSEMCCNMLRGKYITKKETTDFIHVDKILRSYIMFLRSHQDSVQLHRFGTYSPHQYGPYERSQHVSKSVVGLISQLRMFLENILEGRYENLEISIIMV